MMTVVEIDSDFRLTAGQGLLRLACLRGKRADVLVIDLLHRARRAAQIDPGVRSDFLHGGMLEHTQHVGSIGRHAGYMVLQNRVDRRLRRGVRPLSVDAGHRGE